MDKLNIIYVDDQREVLSTISKDLQIFEKFITLEECESAQEAFDVLSDIENQGDHAAVIISDHIMPKKNGVDFFIEVHKSKHFPLTKKVLLTGQATHQDTIGAINNAHIDNYIEKPWKAEHLVQVISSLLTKFVLESGIEYQALIPILDQQTLLENLSHQV